MFKLSDTRKIFVLLTITLMIMFIIPNLAVAGGHGGMGMGGMGMGGMGMGGMSMGMGGYYGYYPSTTTASLLGRYTPYATTIGSPYSAYGYSPYSTRLGSVLGSPLGGYGLGLGLYSGLGGYGGGLYSGVYGGGLYGGVYGGGLYGGVYGGGLVTGKTYGTEQTYTTYVPGGEIGTTVSEYTDVAYPYSYGLLGGGLGAYGLGAYGLGGAYGYNPYGYGLGSAWI